MAKVNETHPAGGFQKIRSNAESMIAWFADGGRTTAAC